MAFGRPNMNVREAVVQDVDTVFRFLFEGGSFV
jgi:hypothetical protein